MSENIGTVSFVLDQIMQESIDPDTRQPKVTRVRAKELLQKELNAAIGITRAQHVVLQNDQVVVTEAGVDSEMLPRDFPENFLQESWMYYEGDGQYSCWSIDSSGSQNQLKFMTPGRFHSKHRYDETASQPDDYTIEITPGGRKKIVLGPTPDAEYKIGGVYRPLTWIIHTENDLSIIGADIDFLTYAVLRRVDPERTDWAHDYQMGLRLFMLKAAQASPTRMRPFTRRYRRY